MSGPSLAALAVAALTACSSNLPPAGQPAPPADNARITTDGDVLTRAQIDRLNVSQTSDLFEGRFAGVQVLTVRGQPLLVIRGYTNPLIVIDGVPSLDEQTLWSLSPGDIEQIRIVKDAGTALYGVRGARGVVEVTTRID